MERGFFRLCRVLVGGEVVLDAHPEGLRYLLLTCSRAVGEELSFSIARDKDSLGYGRWHVALEEDARGERVWLPRGYCSGAVGRRQGRERAEDGVGQFLVLAPLPEEGCRVIGGGVGGPVHVDGDEDIVPGILSLEGVGLVGA